MDKLLDIISYMIILITFVLCITFFCINICNAESWTSHWTINGVRVSDIDSVSNVATIALGAATSAIVHCAGHHLVASALGHDIRQDGLHEYYDDAVSSGDQIAMNMGGFITQLATGTALKRLAPGKFAAGYNAWAMLEVTTYPMIWGFDEGDLSHGIGDAAYPVLTGWAILNLK